MRNRALSFRLPLVAAALWLAPSASAVNIDWVYIGNPGNAADTPSANCVAANCGSVAYGYYISKYEVTNAQYAEFLNAKAASDPLSLYNTFMDFDATNGGITRSGSSGSYTYTAKVGFENKPVTYVSFYDSLRFSNWLNNGQGTGDTETGAYTITAGGIAANTITRNGGANIFLTSENEWYKAAYYDAVSMSYFNYPAGSDVPTICADPGATPNTANCNSLVRGLTDVGSYTASASPNGTYDQGGNAHEWNEQVRFGAERGIRGGSFYDGFGAGNLAASNPGSGSPGGEGEGLGFRVASLIPEPSTGLLVMTGLLGLAYRQRRQRRAARVLPGAFKRPG